MGKRGRSASPTGSSPDANDNNHQIRAAATKRAAVFSMDSLFAALAAVTSPEAGTDKAAAISTLRKLLCLTINRQVHLFGLHDVPLSGCIGFKVSKIDAVW